MYITKFMTRGGAAIHCPSINAVVVGSLHLVRMINQKSKAALSSATQQ